MFKKRLTINHAPDDFLIVTARMQEAPLAEDEKPREFRLVDRDFKLPSSGLIIGEFAKLYVDNEWNKIEEKFGK